MTTIEYSRHDIGEQSIFITNKPKAWFSVKKSDVSSVNDLLKSNDTGLRDMIEKNSFPDRSPSPKHLAMYPVIKLTNRCNLNCSHCYIEAHDSMRSGKHNLSLTGIKDFIDYIIELGKARGEPVLTMQLFGGEPTLHEDFLEIVSYIRSKNIYIRISTNAANVRLFQSGNFDRYFKDYDIEWRVSLESNLPEAHNLIRPNSYHRVVDNLKYMASHGARISIKTVVGNHNYDHFDEIIYFSKEIGAADYLYSPLSLTGNAIKNNISNKITTLMINKKVISIIEEDPGIAPFLRSSPLARYLKLIYLKHSGVLPRVQYFINHDGKICPQDNLYEMPEYHFGDITQGDYSIAELEQYQYKLESNLLACQKCPANGFCPKGDYADLAKINGSFNSEFSVCGDIRELVFYLMSLGEKGGNLLETIYR